MKILNSGKLILIILSICCKTLAQYYSSVDHTNISLLKIQKFNVADGLSQGTIYCSFQDSRGFLWFGTQFGLNRFDGYSYRTFFNNPDDSTSICDNLIYSIAEDKQGNLWIGTIQGLNQFDPNKNLFRHFLNDPTDNNTISSNEITAEDEIRELTTGNV